MSDRHKCQISRDVLGNNEEKFVGYTGARYGSKYKRDCCQTFLCAPTIINETEYALSLAVAHATISISRD